MAVAATRRRRLRLVLYLIATVPGLYALYKGIKKYLKCRATQLIFNDNSRNRRLVALCPSLRTYFPTAYLLSGHAQTIFASLFRSHPTPAISYLRKYLPVSHGGEVALDWQAEPQKGVPTLLLCHGLTGGSDETYMQWMLSEAKSRGMQCVVFNARGCGGSKLKSPRGFTAADTDDLRQVALSVREAIGPAEEGATMFLVGFSLSAGIMVKYLGEEGASTPFHSAVAVGGSYDMLLTTKSMESPVNRALYNRHLTKNLIKWMKSQNGMLESVAGVDAEEVYRSSLVREFDARVVVPVCGYADVWEYYRDASSAKYIQTVAIPLLCINAADDPICDVRGLPADSIITNPNVLSAVTECGGHLAWSTGWLPTGQSWVEKPICEFFEATVATTLSSPADGQGQQPEEGAAAAAIASSSS